MAPVEDEGEWELPRLRVSFGLNDDHALIYAGDEPQGAEFFDVKFYPYSPKGGSNVFAALSKKHVVICRLSHTREKDANPCEVIAVIRDDDEEARNCGCCWSKDPETQRPWLCVGGNDAKIKVYDVTAGKLVKTLVGHGSGVNDLATSPANPWIIATASEDFTVRIWSLAAAHAQQPCVCILGGEGHSWDILSVAFHDTGRYILSAGHDQLINLWTLPDLPEGHVDAPVMVHYPHFSTSEIHSGIVDCVQFLGDLILSRACHEDAIILWRIEGFSSKDAPLPPSKAPTAYDPSKLTRSAFAPVISAARPAQYTRLLQFHTPDCSVQFFLRFKVFHRPGKHPILAFCNAKSKTMLWDLARLPAYSEFMSSLNDPSRDKTVPLKRPSWLQIKKSHTAKANAPAHLRNVANLEKDSVASASPDPDADLGQPFPQKSLDEWAQMYDITNSHGLIHAHRAIYNTGHNEQIFIGRQVAWSTEGDWCVVVGNMNRALIMHRWAKDNKEATPAAA